MAFGYFNQPGLPATLTNIPLEYFHTAIAKLHAATKPPVAVLGYSWGAEAAFLVTRRGDRPGSRRPADAPRTPPDRSCRHRPRRPRPPGRAGRAARPVRS